MASLVGCPVVCGDPLYSNSGSSSSAPLLIAGPGVYSLGPVLHASVFGVVHLSGDTLSVVPHSSSAGSAGGGVLDVGSVVLCRVLRVTSQQAVVSVFKVDGRDLRTAASGVIRREDVHEAAIDLCDVYESFRPDDIVRASVISLGDSRQYFLSTAPPSHGVVSAVSSSSGLALQPVSVKEMVCTVSGAKERRKVARV